MNRDDLREQIMGAVKVAQQEQSLKAVIRETDQIMLLIDSVAREAREQALEDVKMQGYGYDNGTEFVLNITYADLDKLNQLGKG